MHIAPTPTTRSVRGPTACVLASSLLLLAACAHEFAIENRETPVHVWLTAPELAASGGSIDALVYVGAEKVVEGDVRFPEGVPNVAFPTVNVTAGRKTVSVVLAGGRISTTEEVAVGGETWIQIVLREGAVTVRRYDREPRGR